MTEKQLIIDVWRSYLEPIAVVQHEVDSRSLHITLVGNGLPINLEGATVQFYAVKPDKEIVYNACTVTDQSRGKIIHTMTSQTCAVPGSLKCWIEVVKNDGVLRTQEFKVQVQAGEESSEAIESTSEFTALETALGTIGEIENSLQILEGEMDTVQAGLSKAYRLDPEADGLVTNLDTETQPRQFCVTAEQAVSIVGSPTTEYGYFLTVVTLPSGVVQIAQWEDDAATVTMRRHDGLVTWGSWTRLLSTSNLDVATGIVTIAAVKDSTVTVTIALTGFTGRAKGFASPFSSTPQSVFVSVPTTSIESMDIALRRTDSTGNTYVQWLAISRNY